MKHTWEILKQAWTPDLIRLIAHRLHLHPDTVGAWKRPTESEDFPHGTGKTNLLDQTEFLIKQIHKSHPGTAREIAEYFLSLVDRLDRAEGFSSGASSQSSPSSAPCAALASAVKEQSDVVIVLSEKPHDADAWQRARVEIPEAIAALNRLDACLENALEKESVNLKNEKKSEKHFSILR